MKNAAVTNTLKPAILETGLLVQVPHFVAEGIHDHHQYRNPRVHRPRQVAAQGSIVAGAPNRLPAVPEDIKAKLRGIFAVLDPLRLSSCVLGAAKRRLGIVRNWATLLIPCWSVAV